MKNPKCPGCGKAVDEPRTDEALPEWFPFCGERCRMADLGRWMTESYSIGRPITEEDDIPEELLEGNDE